MATRHLRDYLPAILLEESSKNPLIQGFLQVIETFLIGDTANNIHDIYDPHPATLVRAQVEVLSVALQGLKLTLGIPADKPNPFRAGDTVQATTVRTQPSRIHYTTIEERKHVLILQDVLSVADNTSIRLADVTESTRCFRLAPGHQISRGNRISVSQNNVESTSEASGIAVAVDGDFIYLARGLSETFTLDDNASPVFVRRVYEPIEKMIDDLVNLFDPWKTRPDLLPWLASVVGLDISPQWNEYQKRLLLSQIAGLHHRLGTKDAMLKLIDIYVPESRKGRICIDDCESLYRLKITDDNHGQLDLLAQSIHYSPESDQPKVSLLHPTAIVADGTGHYYVADIGGAESETSNDNPAAIWKITESGAIAGKPITSDLITQPIGLATDKSKNLLVLNASLEEEFEVVLISTNNAQASNLFKKKTFRPCGFSYFVLDDKTDLIFVAGKTGNISKLLRFKRSHNLNYELDGEYTLTTTDAPTLIQPISILQISESAFLIGDGKNITPDTADIFYVEIDLTTNNIKKGPIPLSLETSQLTFPSCIIKTADANHFILIDTGLRTPNDGQGFGPSVTTPIIYQMIVNTTQDPFKATLSKITTNRLLCNPSTLVTTGLGEFKLLDKGFKISDTTNEIEFRNLEHNAAIVTHFGGTQNNYVAPRKLMKQLILNLKPIHAHLNVNP